MECSIDALSTPTRHDNVSQRGRNDKSAIGSTLCGFVVSIATRTSGVGHISVSRQDGMGTHLRARRQVETTLTRCIDHALNGARRASENAEEGERGER